MYRARIGLRKAHKGQRVEIFQRFDVPYDESGEMGASADGIRCFHGTDCEAGLTSLKSFVLFQINADVA
jgi:hypothetical protein